MAYALACRGCWGLPGSKRADPSGKSRANRGQGKRVCTRNETPLEKGASRGLATATHLPGGSQCEVVGVKTPTVELFCGGCVGGFDDLAGAQATGADVYPFDASADDGANPLDIRIPAALGPNMRMADAHAKRRLLVADLTYRGHDDS